MNNGKTRKNTLVFSLLALLLCIAMLVATTFAWFTDTVSNTGNRIQAGTLKIDLLMDKNLDGNYTSIANGSGDIFKECTKAQNSTKTLWEPGKTQIVYLAVQNKGNLALKYNIYVDVTDEGLIVGEESSKTSLEYAVLPGFNVNDLTGITTEDTVWNSIKTYAETLPGKIKNIGDLKFDDAAAKQQRFVAAEHGVMDELPNSSANPEVQYFALAVHMKEEAGNEYQGKDAIIDVTVVATQKDAELDGFGTNTYDQTAQFDTINMPVHELSKTEPITSSSTGTAQFTSSGVVESASLPMEAAKLLLPEPTTGYSDNMILNLNVDTTEVKQESTTYEIELSKTVTVSDSATGATISEETSKVEDSLTALLTAELNVGSGLKNVKVTHSGIMMEKLDNANDTPAVTDVGGYFYNASTGKLTVKASKFSPFVVSHSQPYVQIVDASGEKVGEYTTLSEAIQAVGNDETIELLRDIDDAVGISVAEDKRFTVDFKGHTYTVQRPGAGSKGTTTQGFQLLKGSTITFKNGTINCADSNKYFTWDSSNKSNNIQRGIAMIIQNYSNLTLENMIIDGTNIAHNDPYTVRYMVSNNSGTVYFKGATSFITPENDFAFDSCKYIPYAQPTVNIDTTGTIQGKIELSGGKLNITNGTFVGEISEESGYADGNATITGGTFTNDPNKYVADDYTAEKNEETGLWTVKYDPVLKDKDEIKTAMATAKSGDTLKIQAGKYYFGKGLTVPEGVNIVSSSSDDVFIVIPHMYSDYNCEIDMNYIEGNSDVSSGVGYGFEIYSNAFMDLSQVDSANASFKCNCTVAVLYGVQGKILADKHTMIAGGSLVSHNNDCPTIEIGISFGAYNFNYTFK